MQITKTKINWRELLSVYWHPRILSMALLGFVAGAPFLLVFSTLNARLAESGVSRKSIGFFAWISLTYSIKFFWAPVVDRFRIPILADLFGQRRSWMLLAQCLIVVGLVGMAFTNPTTDLMQMAMFALVVAFGSATQDISIDAWRIEVVSIERQAAMTAVYTVMYRVALIVVGAGALYLAEVISWQQVYLLATVFIVMGMVAVCFAAEPDQLKTNQSYLLESRVQNFLVRNHSLPQYLQNLSAWFIGAVVCPFVDFFSRYGMRAVIFLLIIAGYRICDICMAAMSMPFYLDLGFTKTQIANVSGVMGVCLLITGVVLGGFLLPYFGLLRLLLVGAIVSPLANLLFSVLAMMAHPTLFMFCMAIGVENFCSGFAIGIFIAWMSSLTSRQYTATQYALFSSLMTFFAKIIAGFSGIVVEKFGYAVFFAYASLWGLPAIAFVTYLLLKPDAESIAENPKST